MSENDCLFVGEDEYIQEEIPEAKKFPFISPRSACLGFSDSVFDKSVFINLRMEESDFEKTPKKLPRLIFVNRAKLDADPSIAADISPVVLPLLLITGTSYYHRCFISNCTETAFRKLNFLMRDSYLLLPMYINKWNNMATYGVDLVSREMQDGAAGKLRINFMGYYYFFLFGKRYSDSPNKNVIWDARRFYSYRHYYHIVHILRNELESYDIAQTMPEEAICE